MHYVTIRGGAQFAPVFQVGPFRTEDEAGAFIGRRDAAKDANTQQATIDGRISAVKAYTEKAY